VVSQNSIRQKSTRFAMVEVEQAAQPFTSPDRDDSRHVLLQREQSVAKTLVIPLPVVRHVLTHE